jgi:hypothetical protein
MTNHDPEPHHSGLYEASDFLDAPPDALIPEREVSLTRRVLNIRTLGSLAFGIFLLVLLFRFVLNVDLAATWQLIQGASLGLLLAAFVVYYATFPIRGRRWLFILRQVGSDVPYWAATQILFLSWWVNCLVPAKLGDLYRAWLLKGNFGGSTSRNVGTIFVERIADIVVIFGLALAAGFWSFRGRERPGVDAIFVAGFILAAVLIAMLVALRIAGGRVTRFLPVRMRGVYERFREGTVGALHTRSVVTIGLFTVVIWLAEGARVYFVIHALDLPDAQLGISASIFVALVAALLTAIPLTPAGVGFVEAGIVGALTLYGVSPESAVAIALVDRAISIGSLVILGGIGYAFSPLVRRAHGGPVPMAESG